MFRDFSNNDACPKFRFATDGGSYEVRKADFCGEYQSFTQEQQVEDELLLADLARSHTGTRKNHFLMDQCINTTIMDGLFERACCDYKPSDASATMIESSLSRGGDNAYSAVSCGTVR